MRDKSKLFKARSPPNEVKQFLATATVVRSRPMPLVRYLREVTPVAEALRAHSGALRGQLNSAL